MAPLIAHIKRPEDEIAGAGGIDHGLVEYSRDKQAPQEILPVHLYGIQELNYLVGEFFDKALYYLARGYEVEAQAAQG